MSKFKVGDKVQIKSTSEYFGGSKTSSNPTGVNGVIDQISTGGMLPIKVKWENETNNSYKESDLVLIKKVSFKVEKSFILEAHKEACSDWKRKIEREFPDAFKKEAFQFPEKTVITTSSTFDGPLYIGKGNADEEYSGRCLMINSGYDMEIKESINGMGKMLIFTKK